MTQKNNKPQIPFALMVEMVNKGGPDDLRGAQHYKVEQKIENEIADLKKSPDELYELGLREFKNKNYLDAHAAFELLKQNRSDQLSTFKQLWNDQMSNLANIHSDIAEAVCEYRGYRGSAIWTANGAGRDYLMSAMNTALDLISKQKISKEHAETICECVGQALPIDKFHDHSQLDKSYEEFSEKVSNYR